MKHHGLIKALIAEIRGLRANLQTANDTMYANEVRAIQERSKAQRVARQADQRLQAAQDRTDKMERRW